MGYKVVPVSTSAVEIITDNTKRKALWITNASTGSSVYIGPDASITTLNAGSILFAYQNLEIKKDFGDWKGPIYGIVGTTGDTCRVYVWEVEGNL